MGATVYHDNHFAMTKIYSVLPSGSGSITVHRQLAERIAGYRLRTYAPYLEYAPFFLRRLADPRAALVHAPPDHAVFFTGRRQKLVVTFHGYILDPFIRAYSTAVQRLHYATDLRWWVRAAASRATVVTAVSRHTAELVKQDLGYRGDIQVIHNGIDTDRFTPGGQVGRYGIRALFSGNPARRKGGYLLPAIARGLDARIELLYTLGSRNKRSLPDAPNLRSIGAVPYSDMPGLYRSVDLLVMPSMREGLSMTVLEAMACGLPVVASDCSSMPELIVDGKGGFLCRLNDAAHFAEAIRKLAASPAIRHEMGEFNRARVEQLYGVDRMIEEYKRVFAEVLEEN
jgi:glycosyltransferase involved in cell wall biosynthesis